MSEEWKEIEEFPAYSVSTLGRVKNKHGNILTGTPRPDGYMSLLLSREGKSNRRLLHRLVALAFIPNPEGKAYIDHINQDKSDNSIPNLRWATHSENMLNRKKEHPDYITKEVRFRVRVKGFPEKRFLTEEEAIAYRDNLLAQVKPASVDSPSVIIQEDEVVVGC